ncbi:MAG: hypothetical protein ACOY0T_12795 [Myxococcota bacterium]
MQLYPSRNTTSIATNAATALVSLVALIGSPLAARAADAPNPALHLEVDAEPSCTSSADLSERISIRSPRVQFRTDAGALLARARFTTLQSGNVLGELTLVKAGSEPSQRRVVARSCTQAADAMALIIAVTVDPTVVSDARSAKPGTIDGSSPSVSGDRGATSKDAAGQPKSRDAEGQPKRSEAQPKRSESERGEVADALPAESSESSASSTRVSALPRFGAHVSGLTLVGVSPEWMPGVSLDAMAGLDREALWSPAVVLGFTHAARSGLEKRGGTAAFTLDAASLDLCPFRVALAPIEGRACAAVFVGRLSARGSSTSNAPGTVSRPFVATGASAIMAGRVHPLIELWARASVGVNLVRDSFEFAPFIFHTVAPVTVSASVGIGLRSR